MGIDTPQICRLMKEHVATSTRTGYDDRNITFMVWLFDSGKKYCHLLEPSILVKIKAVHEKDEKSKTKKGQPSKIRDHLRDIMVPE